MSTTSLDLLLSEIGHEISRDSKGWYFTQRAAARLCGMDRKTITEGLAQADGPLSAFAPAGKLLKSIAAQGISPAGLDDFKSQWSNGRITDVLVSCLITYAATQKKGARDPEVVRLCGLMTSAGLRALLDAAFGIEDVGTRVAARERGITTRNLCVKYQATHHKNIGAYTAVVTQQITGKKPQQWKPYLRERFGKGSGGIRDHADELTVNLIEVTEAAMAINDVTISQAARFAADIKRSAEKHFQYTEPQLSPVKLSASITHQVAKGERAKLSDPHTNRLPLLKGGSDD